MNCYIAACVILHTVFKAACPISTESCLRLTHEREWMKMTPHSKQQQISWSRTLQAWPKVRSCSYTGCTNKQTRVPAQQLNHLCLISEAGPNGKAVSGSLRCCKVQSEVLTVMLVQVCVAQSGNAEPSTCETKVRQPGLRVVSNMAARSVYLQTPRDSCRPRF